MPVDRRKPKGLRRVERWVVGLGMAVIAFVLEQAVVRSVKRRGGTGGDEPPAITITSHGGNVDVPSHGQG